MELSKLNPLLKITRADMRTSTKFVILNFIVSMTIVFFVSVVLPILCIWFEVMLDVIKALSPATIITAILGQSGFTAGMNMVRIAIENKATKMADGGTSKLKE